MAENLKTTKYSNGDAIPNVTDNAAWAALSTPAYCWYNNEVAYKVTYGALYNWHTVNTGNLCPTGWHVPSDAEWTTLTDYLGGLNVSGGKLKETGTLHWISPNNGATDEICFTALPGGYRDIDGTIHSVRYLCDWWVATEYDAIHAKNRNLNYLKSNVERNAYNKKAGFSVRCVKD
jgi:uncharacterized protein (TIGR02145 family)